MSETLRFSSLTIRGVELRNRIEVPPMHQYFAINEFRHPALNMTERP
jgi:2,4-dienoyl-CoA reductase-like NADH-dependent reductase (Old Yellow Enzyme family)